MKKHIKFKRYTQINLRGTTKRKLEKRREELFAHYREICGFREVENITTGKIEKINFEDDKKRCNYPFLSSIIPKQIIIFRHTLPLKILAFSDYRAHDFKPLLEYVKNLKEKPDIIVYAGDDIERFGPVPLDHLVLGHFNENCEHHPAIERVHISYERGYVSSPSFGFIFRSPKKLRINVKDKIKHIRDSIHSIIQTFNNSGLRSLQVLKNLIQELPIQIEIHTTERKSISDEKMVSLIDAEIRLEIYRFRTNATEEELRPDFLSDYNAFYAFYKDVDMDKMQFIRIKSDKNYVYYLIPNPDQPKGNIFEELAKHARYGVVAILGNDEEESKQVCLLSEYIQSRMKQNYTFVHWGGMDKTLLLKELRLNPQTFNLLYFCQTSLVAPLNSTTLKDVHDVLCGHVSDEWWETNFYGIDGFDKLVLCNILVRNPDDTSPQKRLLEANKADVIALEKVLKVLVHLPVKLPEAGFSTTCL